MGWTRDRLFALTIDDFLRRQAREPMLRRLNQVYADSPEPAEKRLLKGIKATLRRAATER